MRRTVRRAMRWFTLGSGPLKRGTDRVQILARVLLIVVVVAAVPLSLWPADATRVHQSTVAAEQTRDRNVTEAVLLADAVAAAGPDATSVLSTPASRTTPRGGSRTGFVPATPRALAGDKVRVWSPPTAT